MDKTCLKCGHTADVTDETLAECPKCGAIYAKVEAAAALADSARRAQTAAQRAAHAEREHRMTTKRRWFTPQFAIAIYVIGAILIGIPTASLAVTGGAIGLAMAMTGLLILLVGAVVLEMILVVFHAASTLDDCRALLHEIAGRSAGQD